MPVLESLDQWGTAAQTSSMQHIESFEVPMLNVEQSWT
jgi:hypothetical protein